MLDSLEQLEGRATVRLDSLLGRDKALHKGGMFFLLVMPIGEPRQARQVHYETLKGTRRGYHPERQYFTPRSETHPR